MISAQTRLFGLVGHPVRHSLSPAMYNELFRRTQLDARYLAFDVDPRRAAQVGDAIRTLDLVGVNLTVPFKERILAQLDHTTQAAQEAGAVNVVICVDGWLTGYNTDGEGLVRSLIESGRTEFQGLRVVVLGAGGTARAVAAALLDRGVPDLIMLNRSQRRADAAIDALQELSPGARLQTGLLQPESFARAGQNADLVINCTAGPAAPVVAAMDPGILGPGATWVDANYWMEDPPLQALCAHLGVEFQTGHSMLMHQGALSFELFTGHPVDAAQIREFMLTRIHI